MNRSAFLSLGLLLVPGAAIAQESGAHSTASPGDTVAWVIFPTPVEAADYLEYTSFDQMEGFLGRLASTAPEVTVDTLALLPGEEPPGRQDEPALLLVRVGRDRAQTGADGDRAAHAASDRTEGTERPAVLIIGSQHGDEQSGKEATLGILRDLALGPLNPLLDDLVVYAVPMPNPWGTETGQRENARGLDLNRDHTRLATQAVAALHAAYVRIDPVVVIDMHELGLAAYDAEVGLATHPNADSALIKFGRYRIMPYVANELAGAGFSFHEYVTSTPESGMGAEDEESYFTYGPMLASYARNAFALRGAISMLLEAASSREIHDLGRRTDVHAVALRAALEVIASAADEIRLEVEAAEIAARMEAGTPADGPPSLVLRATYETDPRQPVLTWLVLEPEGINTGSTDRWRPAIRVDLTIDRPAGYLIPAGERELVAALERHGFELSVLTRPRTVRVGRYAVPDSGPGMAARPDSAATAAAPRRADDRLEWREEEVPAGTVYLDLDQPAGLLAAAILEPWSQDSWYGGDPEPAGVTGMWYPVTRVESPIVADMRAVPTASGGDILGDP